MFLIRNMAGNQFELLTPGKVFFQSYETPIISVDQNEHKIEVVLEPYQISPTTSKYLNQFIKNNTRIDPAAFKMAVQRVRHIVGEYSIKYVSEINI